VDYLEQLEQGRYGSFELKKLVGRNLLRGLVISVLVHAAVVAAPYVADLFKHEEDIPRRVVVIDMSTLIKLKSLRETPEQVQVARPKIAPPKAAVPIAVPQEQVEEQQELMPSQKELSDIMAQGSDEDLDIGPGTDVVIKEEGEIPDPGVFVPFEVAPTPLPDFSPQPAFPEMAKLAGVQGKVVIQIYVDKKGFVKKWKIASEKPADLGFGDEVIKIIPKWQFTPAIQQGNPVGVWIAIPFNFQYKK
jgi:protein TonB